MMNAPTDSDEIFSVTGLNQYVRYLLEGDPQLHDVLVEGEISGYTRASSGHRYFALKDAQSLVDCMMFRNDAQSLLFAPENGMRVIVRAVATLYPPRGSFQLRVTRMNAVGRGDQHLRFELLKKKLNAEGLFDDARKRPLPEFPVTIGIATSRTGKAVHDIITVARRRNPRVNIIFAPCDVQGASAPADIVRAIRLLNAQGEADVLFVGRGGGSDENLNAYNEEIVARAIAASRIPVVSCVGHKLDTTIADYVADKQAQTPSTAAELAIPEVAKLQDRLDDMALRLKYALLQGQRIKRARLERLTASPAFVMPRHLLIEGRQAELKRLLYRATVSLREGQEDRHMRLAMVEKTLSAVDPQKVIDRGYAIVRRNGVCIEEARLLESRDDISITMAGGEVRATVTGKSLNQENTNGEE